MRLLLLALGAFALPVAAQSYTGTLEAGDEQLISGEYVDWYTVEAQVGQAVVVEMTSTSELDPYILLQGPAEQQAENDDAAPGDLVHSRVVHEVTQGGTFRVGATSFQPGETGTYSLEVYLDARVGTPPGPASPSRDVIALQGVGPVVIGMTPVEAEAAWGSPWASSSEEVPELVRVDAPRLQGACHYTGPAGSQMVFIVIGGQLASLSAWGPEYRTLNGIHVGSTIDEVRLAYPGQIEQEPNIYTEEPELTIVPQEGHNWSYRLVFETEAGRVTMIKAGLAQAVNLPEGCL